MRVDRTLLLPLALVAAALAAVNVAADVPWNERYELTVSPWPGIASDPDRYTKAEILWMGRTRFVNPNCPGSLAQQCELEVVPWDDACVAYPPNEACVLGDLCPATTPFYGQPRPTGGCSGVLVGNRRILTAGHCLGSCPDMVAVIDYAVKSPLDPLGDPIEEPGTVWIPQANIFLCDAVEATESPFQAGMDPDSAFGLVEGAVVNDFALVRLDRPVPTDRLPIPIERELESIVGDAALIVGHPRHIPAKAEVQPIGSHTGGSVKAPFSALGGSSGSGVVNLATGKLVGIARTGPMPADPSTHPECNGLYDLCFGCTNVTAQGMLPLTTVVPPIGLQVSPLVEVDHYGPPTTALDFPGEPFFLSVPTGTGSLPVDWSVAQEGIQQVLEVRQGPPGGTLQPGAATQVLVAPAETSLLYDPGTFEATMPFFDATYGTRTPIRHRVHVGVDGFKVMPTDRLQGPEGLGVPHGTERTYRLANRWSLDQHVTVRAEDPNNPGQWPPWLELNDDTMPLSLTLPCKGEGCGPSVGVQLDVNGANTLPGTYEGRIVFSSDDSGSPPFEVTTEVYFDHCREIFADTTLPYEVMDLPPEQSHPQHLLVTPTNGTLIDDVDMIVELGSEIGGEGQEFEVYLASPTEGEVLLKGENHTFQSVYDDTTSPPPAQPMSFFVGRPSSGAWTLRIKNTGTNNWTFTLERFEVRIRHQATESCVQES